MQGSDAATEILALMDAADVPVPLWGGLHG